MPITVVGTSEITGPVEFYVPYSNEPTDTPPGLINYVDSRYGEADSVTSLNINSRTPETGDFYVTTVVVTNNVAVITPPDVNWVLIRRDDYNNFSLATYYKIITNGPGEPSTWTWAIDVSANLRVYEVALGGVDLTNPIRTHDVTHESNNYILKTAPVSATSEDAIFFVGYWVNGFFFGWDEDLDDDGDFGNFGYAWLRGAPRTGTIPSMASRTSATGENAFHTIVIRPAARVGVVTVDLPVGVQEGDFLLLAVSLIFGPNTVPALPGWSLLRQDALDPDSGPSNWGDDYCQAIFYKFAGPSEPSSYSISIDDRNQPVADSFSYGGWLRAYRGVSTTNPIADSSAVVDGGSGDPPPIPAVTAAAAGSLLVSILTTRGSGFELSPEAGMTTSIPADNDHDMLVTLAEQTVGSGTTGIKTWEKKFAPQIFDVQPNTADDNASGIVITGQYFTDATSVTFNGIAAASFVIDNDTQITATAPVTGYGSFTVLVISPFGQGGFSPYTVTTWERKTDMPIGRFRHDIIELNDGKVLMVGGHTNISDFGTGAHKACYLYDPSNDTWAATGDFIFDRFSFGLCKLPNGKILLSGGQSTFTDTRLYDPVAGTWSSTGSMLKGRGGHSLTLLSNGLVLAAGGDNGGVDPRTSELYNPGTATWGSAANLATTSGLPQNQAFHVACTLSDNRVVILGGVEPNNPSDSDKYGFVQIYTPGSNSWTRGARMPTKVWDAAIGVTSDDRIVVVGGQQTDFSIVDTIQVYNASTDSWSTLTSVYPGGVNASAQFAMLTTDEFLVFGGAGSTYRRDSFLIDIDADTVTPMGDLPAVGFSFPASYYSRANNSIGGSGKGCIRLSDGRVLVVAGFDYQLKTNIYTRP